MEMNRIFYIFLFTVLILGFPTAFLSAQTATIEVVKDAKTQNPTIQFLGCEGNAAVQLQMQSDLINCGWFRVVGGGKTEYRLSARAGGQSVVVSLFNGEGQLLFTKSVPAGNDDVETAHKAVDTVLRELFGIPGICNTKIVFSVETASGIKEIYLSDFDGQRITPITRFGMLCIDPVWTPSGSTIIYGMIGKGAMRVVEVDPKQDKSRVLSKYGGMNAGGRLSPDGRHIALVLSRDGQVDLYLRPADQFGGLKRLTKDKAVEAGPCWSPDGKKLCYVSDASGRPLLYVVDPFSGTAPQVLRGIAGSERVTPSWSGANQIAYSAKVGRDYVLAVADMSGGTPEVRQIGLPDSPAIVGEGVSWAPDNRHVVIANNGVLYVADTRLGTVRKLLSGKSRVSQPDWSPLFP